MPPEWSIGSDSPSFHLSLDWKIWEREFLTWNLFEMCIPRLCSRFTPKVPRGCAAQAAYSSASPQGGSNAHVSLGATALDSGGAGENVCGAGQKKGSLKGGQREHKRPATGPGVTPIPS